MKNILTLLLLTFTIVTFAQSVEFEKGEWSALLAKAKAEDKLIFMDAYTVWCGPCKLMSKEVFTDAALATFFNENFINAKVDMEKGEGPGLAVKYQIKGYPTLLFINGDGEVVRNELGYRNVEELMTAANNALDPSQSITSMADRFEKGDRDPAFLKTYVDVLFNADDHKFVEVAHAYMEEQSDWTTPENEFFIFKYADEIDSPMFDYIFKNKAKFVEMYGVKIVEGKIEQAFNHKMFDPERPVSLEDAKVVFQRVYPEKADLHYAKFKMKYHRNRGEREGYAKAAVEYVNNFEVNDDLELNDMAWTFYEVIDDKDLLGEAVKWSKKSVKIEDNYYNNDTLAALYYKLGKKCKAKKAANNAIEIAKANNEDPAATEELLEKINEL